MNRFQKMRKVCKGYLERIPPLLIQSFQWGADWLREKILDLGEYLKRNSLRILALNTPYVIIFYLVDKEAWLYQYCQGDSSVERLMVLLLNFQMAFTSVLPSIEKMPLLAGFTGALAVKLLVMMKMKNAKKFRQGVEYGSARWGTAKDIAPFIDPIFENNILLTMTERLTMNGRPKNPKFARNKNVIVIGGSGSGKTRFYVKPNLMQMGKYISYGIKRVINNAKVSDHHAILPTKEAVEKGIADLPADKKNLMMLICQQLVQATGEEYLYEQPDITVKCQEHDFKARGKIPVQMGFKEVEKAFKHLYVKAEPVEGKEKETSIPAGYEEGMRLFPVKADKTTHYTSPPKPFNEDTLLAAMETAGNKEFDSETEKKGLGTPATRASIIEKLVSSGYAQRKGKQILPSTEGKELVKVMPEYLKSAVMTAEWENRLLMMEKGQITDTQFMGEITSLVRKILEVCREIPEEERRRFQTAREVIGKCPVCGCDVFEGKQNFYCSSRQCDFVLWKENRFLGSMAKNLDKKMARELLDKACTHVKGLYSKKKDMKFDADLLLTLEDGKPRFHLEFPKKKKK